MIIVIYLYGVQVKYMAVCIGRISRAPEYLAWHNVYTLSAEDYRLCSSTFRGASPYLLPYKLRILIKAWLCHADSGQPSIMI